MGITEIIGFALALIGFLTTAWVWFHSVKVAEQAEVEKKALASKLMRAETRGKQVEAKAQALTTRARELEKDLAEAVARRDQRAMAKVMWDLELERSYRQWRDVIVPDPTSVRPDRVNTGQQLTFAIGQEVERLREEVGVSIRYESSLALDLEPETALGALRIVEELLALAAKCADEILVSADHTSRADHASSGANSGHDGAPAMSVIVDCIGWESVLDPTDSELNVNVSGMAERLDGWVHWNREGDDHLVITVQLPVEIAVIDTARSGVAPTSAS